MEEKINVHWSWYTRIVTVLLSLLFVGIVWRELRNFLAVPHDYGALLYMFVAILLFVVYAINAPISVRLTPQYFELKKIVGRQAFLIRTVQGNVYVFSTEAPDKNIEELKKMIK